MSSQLENNIMEDDGFEVSSPQLNNESYNYEQPPRYTEIDTINTTNQSPLYQEPNSDEPSDSYSPQEYNNLYNDYFNNFENDTITNNIRRRNSSSSYLVTDNDNNQNENERGTSLLEINIENINRTINSNSQVSEDMYECTICNENHNQYYRICDCNPDIILCRGCIRNLERHQFMECPFCRNRLQITQYKKRMPNHKEIQKILLLLLFILISEITMPIILTNVVGEKDNSKNNNFVSVTNTPVFLYVLCFISVFIIKPIVILLFNLVANNVYSLITNNNYTINYFISTGIGIIYMIMIFNNSNTVYHELFMVVILPFYIIPLILLILFLLYVNISYIFKNIYPLNTMNRITPIDSFELQENNNNTNNNNTNNDTNNSNNNDNLLLSQNFIIDNNTSEV